MTKKTLIELMLENDVKWPEGMEFAAQDKLCNKLCFYNEAPKRKAQSPCWNGHFGYSPGDIELPELCRNWHCTVVTREQYEAAQVRRNAAKRIIDDTKTRTIDAIIANIKECDEKITHHSAELATYTEGRAKFVGELNGMLAGVGMKAVDNTLPAGTVIKTTGEELHTEHPEYEVSKPSQWPDYCDENGIVVDWGRVPEGSEVECVVHPGAYSFDAGSIYIVGRDKYGDYGPIDEDGHAPKAHINKYKFRLVK